MKGLVEYINEAVLRTADFTKHNFKYLKAACELLLDNQQIRLGASGTLGVTDINDFDKETLEEIESKIDKGDTDTLSVNMFNNSVLINSRKTVSWSKLCKFDIRKIKQGTGNMGNDFEDIYKNNIINIDHPEHKKILNEIGEDIALNENTVITCGGKNTSRPLQIRNDNLVCGNIKEDTNRIGASLADIRIITDTNNYSEDDYTKNIYLSLKYGNTVSFANPGIQNKDLITTDMIKNKSYENVGDIGKKLIETFGIDWDKMCEVFNNYKEKAILYPDNDSIKSAFGDNVNISKNNVVVDITSKVSHNKILEYIKSVVGYGYILVHEKNGKIYYIDLREKQQSDELIGKSINSITIKYPLNGNAKRIDINIELLNMKIRFNIRNKNTSSINEGIYPSHFMADYTIYNKAEK